MSLIVQIKKQITLENKNEYCYGTILIYNLKWFWYTFATGAVCRRFIYLKKPKEHFMVYACGKIYHTMWVGGGSYSDYWSWLNTVRPFLPCVFNPLTAYMTDISVMSKLHAAAYDGYICP